MEFSFKTFLMTLCFVGYAYAQGNCGRDGIYYNDETSYTVCTHGVAYQQSCPHGTRNGPQANFAADTDYPQVSFCNVNLLAHGYQVEGGYHEARHHSNSRDQGVRHHSNSRDPHGSGDDKYSGDRYNNGRRNNHHVNRYIAPSHHGNSYSGSTYQPTHHAAGYPAAPQTGNHGYNNNYNNAGSYASGHQSNYHHGGNNYGHAGHQAGYHHVGGYQSGSYGHLPNYFSGLHNSYPRYQGYGFRNAGFPGRGYPGGGFPRHQLPYGRANPYTRSATRVAISHKK